MNDLPDHSTRHKMQSGCHELLTITMKGVKRYAGIHCGLTRIFAAMAKNPVKAGLQFLFKVFLFIAINVSGFIIAVALV